MSSKKPWPGPPAGVSTTDGEGGHTPIEGAAAAPVGNPSGRRSRRQGPGDDVLQNVHELQAVGGVGGLTPDGVQAVQRDVRIGKMPKTRRSVRNTVKYESVDGEEYTFRTRDQKGKELETNRLFLLFAAMREIILGGNPKNVFDAWDVRVLDMDGKQFYPLPQEILERMQAEREVRDYRGDIEEDEDSSQFVLGQAD